MCDLLCHVISCCVLGRDTSKINVCDKIVIENRNTRENACTEEFRFT